MRVTKTPMSIVLQLQGISKSFGLRRLFDEATVSVAEGQRIGLIGANGSGKTTLLRMILGQESLDEGKVVLHPNARLGYLEQNEVFPPNETVIDYLVRVSDHEPWECAKMAGSFEIKHEKLEAPFLSLSGGYQMRVRLAGILVRDPEGRISLARPPERIALTEIYDAVVERRAAESLLEAAIEQPRAALGARTLAEVVPPE